jgi:hypothetical protein
MSKPLTKEQYRARAQQAVDRVTERSHLTPRQKMVGLIHAFAEFVGQHGPEAKELRKLKENRASVIADTLLDSIEGAPGLAVPRLEFIERAVFAAAPRVGNLILLPDGGERLRALIEDIQRPLREEVEAAPFIGLVINSPELAWNEANRAINTRRKAFTRAQRKANTSSDPEEQAPLPSPQLQERLARYTTGLSWDPLTEAAKLEAAERVEAWMATLKPRDQRVVGLILDGGTDEGINEVSRAWKANGRGVAVANIRKLRERLRETLVPPAKQEAAPEAVEEIPAAAEDQLTPEAAAVSSEGIATGGTVDVADIIRSDLRQLSQGGYLTLPTDSSSESSQSGASRRDRVMRGETGRRQYRDRAFVTGTEQTYAGITQGPGVANLTPERLALDALEHARSAAEAAAREAARANAPPPKPKRIVRRAPRELSPRAALLQGRALDGLERERQKQQQILAQKAEARQTAVREEQIARKELRGTDLRLQLAKNEAELAELRAWAEPFCEELGVDINSVLGSVLRTAANEPETDDVKDQEIVV